MAGLMEPRSEQPVKHRRKSGHQQQYQRKGEEQQQQPYAKLTVVLDMDECILHTKFTGANAYRQTEERPDHVRAAKDSFWVALDDGDAGHVNLRPGVRAFLQELSINYTVVVFSAAMSDYGNLVLDQLDPTDTLISKRLFRNACRQRRGAFLKDLSAAVGTDLARTVLVDNNPFSFLTHPTNGVLVSSFYDDEHDSALESVLQLIHHLDRQEDVRPILGEMFRLETLLGDYRKALGLGDDMMDETEGEYDDDDDDDDEDDDTTSEDSSRCSGEDSSDDCFL